MRMKMKWISALVAVPNTTSLLPSRTSLLSYYAIKAAPNCIAHSALINLIKFVNHQARFTAFHVTAPR